MRFKKIKTDMKKQKGKHYGAEQIIEYRVSDVYTIKNVIRKNVNILRILLLL